MLIKKNRIPVFHIITIGILPSFIKKIIYRAKGYKIGSHVSLSFGSVVIGKKVEIGSHSHIGFFTVIRARHIKLNRYIKIGAMSFIDTESISIDDDARINEQVYIGGMKTPQSSLILGKRTIIMQGSYINPTMPITIGDDSGIGGQCLLFTHGSWNSQLEGYPVKFGSIEIGKKVWLPWRVFVMPGVTIGDGAVIGADSTITKNIPKRSLAAGSPAKIIKENYPTPIDEKQKNLIFENILTDFIAYLSYHNFNVELKQNNSETNIIIKRQSLEAFIQYSEFSSESYKQSIKNSILVLLKENFTKTNSNFGMMISLQNNTRIGTSDVGEELVSFLSRYGIRFNRLD